MTHNTNDTNDTEYNGHKSKGHWNVSLWLTNDETLYQYVMNSIEILGSAERASVHVAVALHGTSTPDGFPYTLDTIREAMENLV